MVCNRKVVTTDASNTGWGGAVRRQTDLRPLVESGEGLPHQLLGDASSMSSLPVFPARPNRTPCADSLRQHVRGVLHKSSGRCLLEAPLEWAQLNLRSLRAAHLPGRLNQGADMWSRSNVPSEEWMLHPRTVRMIWKTFGKSEVDLFASKDSSHCGLSCPYSRPIGGQRQLSCPFSEGSQEAESASAPYHPYMGPAHRTEGPPFEPLQSTNLRPLSLKTALLLALASVKRVGDLQALSISPACLEFGPNDSKVILKPRHGYVPKVLSTPFRAQVITLSVLPPSEEDRELSLLCPVRALKIYFEHSASFRHTEQLFVSFGNRAKGHPVTKQRLSKWIVDAVMLAYSSLGLQCPIGVQAHSTRGIASSWAWSSGVSITEICAAAGWASPSTFARFYNLDVPALQARVLSA